MLKKTLRTAAVCAALIALAAPVHADSKGHDMDHGAMGKKAMEKPMSMDGKMHKVGTIMVEAPWARASARRGGAGAIYFTLRNAGGAADRLVETSTTVAKRTEIHTHVMRDNVMRMTKIDHVKLPAKSTATFKPGGHHVMLMGLEKPLKEGDTVSLTLRFEKAGSVTVPVKVRGITAKGPGRHSGHGKSH